MVLHIEDPVAERLARQLAELTGESVDDAVITALRLQLARVGARAARPDLLAAVASLQAFVAAQPVRDARGPDELLGFDEHGLPR